MKKAKKILAVIFTASFCGFCLLFPFSVKEAAAEGINRCIFVIIPSLYAMMTASAILMKSGLISCAGRFIRPVSRLFFGINGELGGILLFSLIAGYPVGAKMIYSVYTEGRLSKRGAEVLSGLCFGSGAAFVFGCAASSAAVGGVILLSNILADLILAALLSRYLLKNCQAEESTPKTSVNFGVLNDCIVSSGRSMLEVCLCIVIFAVFSEMLRTYNILPIIAEILPVGMGEPVLCAILDVTAISGISARLPVVSGLISFGGVCVFLQITAIFRGKLSILPLVVIRIAAAVLSGVICRLLMPFIMSNEAVDVFAVTGRLYRETSPIPSVMLIIMSCVLIAESFKGKIFAKKGRDF
ncbi:MAG: hypothetical protein J6B75_07830 [Ruminococcus sp.]|nr:hypothetical protein [Ruminococcus sp.]